MFFRPLSNPARRDDSHLAQNVILFLFVQEPTEGIFKPGLMGNNETGCRTRHFKARGSRAFRWLLIFL